MHGTRPWEEDRNEKLGENLTENQEKIIRLISENVKISIPVIATSLKISTTAVENNIKKLKKMGLILRIGPAKGGYWEIIHK